VTRRLTLIDRVFSEARQFLPRAVAGQQSQSRPIPIKRATSQEAGRYEFPDSDHITSSKVGSDDSGDHEPSPAAPIIEPKPVIRDRIELGLPDGNLSLPETLANLDAALTVLWARRQLVAAIDAADGRATPTPPRDFSNPSPRNR
jgi:hypothetical protein